MTLNLRDAYGLKNYEKGILIGTVRIRFYCDSSHKEKSKPPQLTGPLCSLLLACFVASLVFFLVDLVPFGNLTLLVSDFKQQYYPFLEGFRNHLLKGESFLYSTQAGIGYNFWANFAYYLSSPLNLLLLAVPNHFFLEGVHVLILIKIGLIAGTTHFALQEMNRQPRVFTTALSLCFALSSFLFTYIIHLMWLDVLILLPLTALGLYRLVTQNRWGLYVGALALSIWSNFYLSFMTCRFLFLLFPYFYLRYSEQKSKQDFIQKGKSFVGWSIVAAGLTSVLLIPTIRFLALTGKADVGIPYPWQLMGTWRETISRLFPESPATSTSRHGKCLLWHFTSRVSAAVCMA